MSSQTDIPRKSIYRLSIYQRCLERLRENGLETVSSNALAKAAGVKSTQLRKDLAHFGQFGTRGLGYNVEALIEVITGVLGTNSLVPVILVGVGNLGAALLRYSGFVKEGFEISAAFEADPNRAKLVKANVPVMDASVMAQYVNENNVKIAILAVPPETAQEVANNLVQVGVQAFLNFSPTVLKTPDNVIVNSVDLALELEHLSYFVK
ncbi:MAG: redox-sensing transcriptional repressor Rex [Verrucomicrobiales bacterium]|jgi:redox-sensing transcriptional repressor|nr:redox-sensing transcriptional repressor Rex [Akkermansiaceae bacterium]MDG1854232.1 redox-sensing transcriptional repressor Rex [Verrucomicrobiales bacterium]MDP6860304.1 redox-sensing transcriptional repressor Rex [Verrucomicrobiales bacterium]MEC7357837.1 redox-sensing transcriptional repressor Rex [Verrucomicrobiota bacterium]|tara:strand:+ start:616 stop:1239 length:624 start_codon:yes stop_codon:yes gene_type:complete